MGHLLYYFNDPWQWPKIWSYNPQITNPHWIYPGDLVRLLPRGQFAQQRRATKRARDGAGEPKPVDNLPPPATRTSVGLKQIAFVEKSDLDKSITIDGSVDEKELLGNGDAVYLSYPTNNPPEVGKTLLDLRARQRGASSGKDVGAYVHLLGTVEVDSVKQDKRARGVITDVEPGDRARRQGRPAGQAVQERAAGRAEGRRAGHDRRDARRASS